MSTVAELLALNEKRLELEVAVDQLTLPSKVDRGDDAGHGETLPLLAAIEAEQASTSGEGFRSTTLASVRAPARMTATELLVDLDRVVGTDHARGRVGAVRSWGARAGSSPELGVVTDAAGLAGGWVVRARAILEPRRYLPLRGAICPQCGHRQVVSVGNAGERIVEPALVADLHTVTVACTVDGCSGAWQAEQLWLLADVLDQQTAGEVLGLP